jgi:phage terminase large subunit-like protein
MITYAQLPEAMRPTPHPVYQVLDDESLNRVLSSPDGHALYADWFNKRERLIQLERYDPLRYGTEPAPIWPDARALLERGNDLLILGGNRASKTEFAAKFTVECLMQGDARKSVWCFQSDERASVERLQPVIHKYLPPDLRDIGKKGRITNVCFTVKNGFSEGVFVMPNASVGRFMSYSMDPRSLEGAELDLCWCDEMVPADMLETLRFRLATRGGKMLVTFTPLEGYSVAVKQYLEGARIVKTLPAPLLAQEQVHVPGCPKGHMPYVLECAAPGRFVILFFSQYNPYSPYENIVNLVANSTVSDKKVRAYGWPEKQIAGAFPKFGDIHIVPTAAIPKSGTNYCVADPGGAKNWFILWLRVDELGRVFVYREWPDYPIYGEWALASDKPDGKPGPAQRLEAGRGVIGYKHLLLQREGWEFEEESSTWNSDKAEIVFERIIDPRAGAASVPSVEDGTSIIELMLDDQLDRDGQVIGPSMSWAPAPGSKIEEGVALINDLLSYRQDAPLDFENAPKLYVSDACKNLIFALRTWTGADGEKGASKDPVDCLRYAVKHGLEHVDLVNTEYRPGRGF